MDRVSERTKSATDADRRRSRFGRGIGALAGGGKGALIGAGAGAGAGTAGAAITGKKEVGITAETPLRFTLRREVAL